MKAKNRSEARQQEIKNTIMEMADAWPSQIIARREVKRFTGGLFSSGYLANLDCTGDGPPSFNLGRQRVYPVKDFCIWLVGRLEV